MVSLMLATAQTLQNIFDLQLVEFVVRLNFFQCWGIRNSNLFLNSPFIFPVLSISYLYISPKILKHHLVFKNIFPGAGEMAQR